MRHLLYLILLFTLSTVFAAEPPPSWSEQEAQGRDADDMLFIARRHMETDPPDEKETRYWLQEAAGAGSADAMGMLGVMHAEGLGVEEDAEQAAHWFTRAVEAGAREYTLQLGWLHLHGHGVPRSRERAEHWFRQGIEADLHPARVALASLLITDAHEGRSPGRVKEAQALLTEALDGDVIVASFLLASIHIEGVGDIQPDPVKAVHYTRMGADKGHAQMQGWLSVFYAGGKGVEQDVVEAMKWSILAAAEGDPLGNQLRIQLQAELDETQLKEARERAVEWLYQKRRRDAGLVD
ncbi:MAG: tetratricopeptide repeat protein [Thioalkalivibrio sp.]